MAMLSAIKPLAFLLCPIPEDCNRALSPPPWRGWSPKSVISMPSSANGSAGPHFASSRRQELKPSQVHLIGSHGQTIHRLPTPVREYSIGPIRSRCKSPRAFDYCGTHRDYDRGQLSTTRYGRRRRRRSADPVRSLYVAPRSALLSPHRQSWWDWRIPAYAAEKGSICEGLRYRSW